MCLPIVFPLKNPLRVFKITLGLQHATELLQLLTSAFDESKPGELMLMQLVCPFVPLYPEYSS